MAIRIRATTNQYLIRLTRPRLYPEYSSPPVEPTYAEPVTTDPWAESSDPSTEGSTAGVAKGEAKNVAGTAAGEGKAVAGTAAEEGKAVAGTAVEAGKDVAATAKDEAANVAAEAKVPGQEPAEHRDHRRCRTRPGTQQGRLASDRPRTYAEELKGLADGSAPEPGRGDRPGSAGRADKGSQIVQWLEEPGARRRAGRACAGSPSRRPVMFLALCGLAGVVAGRHHPRSGGGQHQRRLAQARQRPR